MLEIGPGKGALTRRLLDRCRRLIVIELDAHLAALLHAEFGERIEVIERDVLDVDLAAWGPCLVAGNLPYYITSPILRRIFSARSMVRRAVLLIQREVAERLTAQPSSRDYGFLSVMTQVYSEPRILFTVPPGAFRPPPKVESAVVRLDIRREAEDADAFLEFAGLCFEHKRKTLRNNLAGRYGEAVRELPEAGMRAEQLSVDQLRALWRALSPARLTPSQE